MYFRKIKVWLTETAAKILTTFFALSFLFTFSTEVDAKCGIKKGSIRVLGNDFGAIHAMINEAQKCAGGKVKFKKNLTKEHKNLQVAALTSDPSQYTAVIIATSSIVPLLNDNLIRPLDDLVRKYGKNVGKNQLIRHGNKIMAVSVFINSQHLVYRADILKKAGLKVPKTYEEVLKAAKIIQQKKLMKYPLGSAYKAGWNLAEEFMNMYMGYGGKFFKGNTAKPNINSEAGIKTLEMMKKLSKYMNPDFLTFDSNAISAEWEAGNVAIMNLWGSRLSPLLDGKGSTKKIEKNTKTARAPTVGGGKIPAATLWWDGFSIAKNIPDEDAEASFKAMLHGSSAKMANTNGEKAVWIIKGFKAKSKDKKFTAGNMANFKSGTKPYPMLPYMGLLHNTIGSEIVTFFQGKESARKALRDTEKSYTTKAKEKGFLK